MAGVRRCSILIASNGSAQRALTMVVALQSSQIGMTVRSAGTAVRPPDVMSTFQAYPGDGVTAAGPHFCLLTNVQLWTELQQSVARFRDNALRDDASC